MNYSVPFVVGGVGVYFGYFYIKGYIKIYLTNRIMDEVNKILAAKQDEDGVLFKPMARTNSAVIHYKHGGKEHKVCVPYDRSKSRPMLRKDVFLINDDDSRIEITHKPGVPYLLSAGDMGGSKIIVIKDNKIIKEYEKTDVPNYLE